MQPLLRRSAVRRLLRELPPELMEHILSYLQGMQHFPLGCTRVMAPDYWRRLLVEKCFVL